MKRIAIITFHRTNNYGAALQAYALQKVLSKKYTATILDYRSPYLEAIYLGEKSGLKDRIRSFIRRIIYPIKTRQLDCRKERFTSFYSRYHVLSERTYNKGNIASANDCYDLFVTGSDQVWNPHLSRGDWSYFLDFAPSYKRYSYAASVSKTNTNDENERIRNELNQFQSILIREYKAADFLKSIGINQNVTAVCDPVFLLRADEWQCIYPLTERIYKKRYVLLYTVANVKNSFQFAQSVAKHNHIGLISISSNQSVKTIKGIKSILDAGPIEFLNYIRNAEYVITSSFHAMALAIIFNVPFYYELCQDGSNNNERLENIAEIFSLEDRQIISNELNTIDIIPDWDRVNAILEKYRKESTDILFNSLEGRSDLNE